MNIVYKLTNTINGKSYIGMTSRTIEQRWASHLAAVKSGSKFRFHCAIRKYGPDVWIKEIIHESLNLPEIRRLEEREISERNLMDSRIGYNAKSGGCGGWVVSDKNYSSWLKKITAQAQGASNPRALKLTNNELIKLAIKYSKEIGRIPSHREFYILCKNDGIKIPKTFTQYRFDGDFKNLIEIVEKSTELKYLGVNKSNEHREKLSSINKGKLWWSCDELLKSIQSKEKDLNKNYTWYRGRKYGIKNRKT